MKYLIFIILFLFSLQSLGQEATTVTKGQIVPFTGTLLDPIAAAKILVDSEYQKKECDLKSQYDTQKLTALCNLDLGNLKIELNTAKEKYDIMMKLKDAELTSLRSTVVKLDSSNNNRIWWFGGGAIVGIISTIGLYYLVSLSTK